MDKILNEIDYYEKQIIHDPAGSSLYEVMLKLAKQKLKEVKKNANGRK